MSETHARVTEVMVTALPLDHPDLRYLTVWVQRMTFGEAKALAAEIAPTLTVNGLTVADVIARRAVKP